MFFLKFYRIKHKVILIKQKDDVELKIFQFVNLVLILLFRLQF